MLVGIIVIIGGYIGGMFGVLKVNAGSYDAQ